MEKSDIEVKIKTGDQDRRSAAEKADKARAAAIKASDDANKSLAEFRWHWTRDPENADTVSQREYAKITGVSEQQVSVAARGWELWQEDQTRSLGECVLQAKLGAERWEATLQVAKLRGKTPATVDATMKADVKAAIARNRANAADKAEREQGKTDETKTATVTPINDAKSVKTVKADANKVAKGAPVKPALSAVPEVEEAQWEPPTDRDVTDGLGTITDSVKHVAKMIDYFTALKAPASMIMERVEILNKIIEDIGKLGQDVRQIMIGAELDTDDAKSTKVKKAQ